MPYILVTDVEGIDVHVTLLSPVTPAELTQYFTEVMDLYDSFTGKRSLIVADHVRVADLNYRSMREFAKLTSEFEARLLGSRTAVVTPGNIAFGLTRMYLSVRDPAYDIAAFRSRDEALAWLCEPIS